MVALARRTVVTGMGVLSPVGSDPASFWQALLAGQSGIRHLTVIDSSRLPVQIAAELPDFDAKKFLDKKHQRSLRLMARTVQLGVAAAQRMLDDAAYKPGVFDPFRFGIEFGAGMIATELTDLSRAAKSSMNCQPGMVSMTQWGEVGLKEIPPLWMLKYLPNMPACHVSIIHDAQGPNNSITESDVAGLLAAGEAYRILQRNLADFMLVGGCESKMNPLSLVRHTLFQPLSRHNSEPARALRPFDAARDGTVLGEGATVLGFESLDSAQKRGVNIYGEIVGFAGGCDVKREGKTLARVIRRALQDAQITPDQVDHVNAHAQGSVDHDPWEARAIADVFGTSVPVVSYKPMFGHQGAGSGLMELAVSLLALQHGQLPGTLNCDSLDSACPIQVHTGDPRPVSKPYALKLGYTELGQCAALVVRRWE
ncbi:beta-ketoacyl-[acyl-carrier-protein] synthase family protein [Tuwongella immobilis]|uniref:Ketosynthase family 3 (KS3) domain-containing protein n=1 Tax=Tuwongella immobilis TaxID=692036 RepID=A0A6C2YGI1_9BACT|nr:beta-ketoacyl-[acyl-carrier-protein] synthase family protein [Tuwongella immobilis]VIP00596.1 3-oxoacyl-acp synthase : 3-oxoacyl-(Acyl carrier protein) synthase OS=Planctomyces maris DSM 8797 GN=PM8797T_28459 PE=3 SV=1: ketoacyl-synt: Ketoacyl-synt_C [Tuwongella immobilis]VTR96610.1 3-oxoacyl-acp synthase : 3-oxoacyl-(Acyl carrier protein) synthase OS=Planctomyces maris DSM 8797 GN=PM8797T_28459 PE=3 SV=1: ketoacyl-synt: Ketoacyl-synt_C [Tuwongella immobilis]